MATKRRRMVRYTDRQLKARRAAGKTGSDWRRAAKAAIPDGSDPDDAIGPVDINRATKGLSSTLRKAYRTPSC